MSKPVYSIHAKMHRTETIVRGEDNSVRVYFLPKPAFEKLNEEEKESVLYDLRSLPRLNLMTNGDVRIASSYLDQYVFAEVEDEGQWTYDGGECEERRRRACKKSMARRASSHAVVDDEPAREPRHDAQPRLDGRG